MSCCVSKLDLCRLIQESYKSPTFNFGDTDVTNDTFVYKVKIAGESFTEYPCTVIAPNIVVIDEYTLPVGNYIHEMLWTSANGTELIFQGALKITSVGSCCGSSRNNTIKVIQNETVVRINVTESNITIKNGEWGSIEGDINEQTDLIELVDSAVNDMATQTWVENQNYLTEETDPTVPSHVKSITTTDISNWNGKQNQLTAGTNISIVGNTISSTVNLNGYATETWVNSQGFSKFSGSYNDLTNKPALFSGNYNDLTNKPTIPTVGNGTITITQGGVSKGSFTTNQSGNTTVEVDAGGGGGADLMVNITHADLLALVNTNSLVAGQQYRITDYVATVDTDVYNPNGVGFYARSNNHAFDVIVTADNTNKLNENTRAIRHEGDTYFPSNTKFEAWRIKYTIYNDSERFDWAVSTGKGVIYQLIDEFNNDLTYDFKSIQFQRNDVWVYTFGGSVDASLEFENCYNNTVLNNGISLNNNTFGEGCVSNTFGEGCSSNTFGDSCRSNTFGDGCSSNIFGDSCRLNTFGDSCRLNTFGNDCVSNIFGDSCRSNIFENDCYSNTFGNSCRSNTLGNDCYSNIFGDGCDSNIFGNDGYSNIFGNDCYSNTLGVGYNNYNISSSVSNINFISEITNFTTPPNGNVVNVIKTPSGVVFSQVINATTTESFDVV